MWSFGISSALTSKREHEDKQFLALLKTIYKLFLTYFPLLYLLHLIQRCCLEELFYPVEDEIVLTTTRVIFTRSKRTTEPICLKLWQRSDDEVCNDKLVIRNEDYLLEGLAFNRKFAPGVYLGIAPITLRDDAKKIRRGRLIENPKKDQLKQGVKYALVMKCLNNYWRLDHQLCQSRLGGGITIDFLAREVARLHRQLEKSPANHGTADSISSKLNLNRELFLEALSQLAHGQNSLAKYSWISDLTARVCEDFTELFMRRYQNSYIKYSHGDLKATNLWVRPAKNLFFGLKKYPQQLLALDCVDFNPEFCHIDTLSDVAMLAIDIEMHAKNWPDTNDNKQYGQGMSNYFIYCYLQEINEKSDDAWPLLQYYMTEKAMVCAYVSILYDGQPELGERYLDIANTHAKQLEMLIGSSVQAPALLIS